MEIGAQASRGTACGRDKRTVNHFTQTPQLLLLEALRWFGGEETHVGWKIACRMFDMSIEDTVGSRRCSNEDVLMSRFRQPGSV